MGNQTMQSAPVQYLDALSSEDGASRAIELFRDTFGAEPDGVWSAPGRVNLIGEHTDYNAGLCLPIALPHRTFVALSARGDDTVRLVSSIGDGGVTTVDLGGLAARGVHGWAAYPAGVAWALRENGFDGVRGFDAAFVSCVPVGGGLSSSAAMTCSTALALDDVYGLGFGNSDEGRVTLIGAAMKAENDMAGASTGGLDQNASMRCTPGHAILLDCRPELDAFHSVTQQPFDLEALGLELLVLDTQAAHQLNDGQYETRRGMCEDATRLLGVKNIRVVADEISHSVGLDRAVTASGGICAHDFENVVESADAALAEVLGRLSDETMKRRVRHVVTEIWRVPQFVAAFSAGDVKMAGELFNASHDSLAADYEVTVPELDVAVDTARRNGAYGARMTGGGFGGSIIALVDKGQGRRVAQSIADGFAAHGFRAPRALAAVASDSARREA